MASNFGTYTNIQISMNILNIWNWCAFPVLNKLLPLIQLKPQASYHCSRVWLQSHWYSSKVRWLGLNWTWRSSIKNRPNFHQFVDELRKWGGHWPGIVSSFRRRSRKARRSVCDNQGWDCDFRTGWQLSTRPLILGRCGLPTTATRRQLNPSRPSSARWDEFADNPWQSNLSEGQNFDAFSTLSDKISHLLEAFEALILEPSATNAIPDPKLPRPGIGEKTGPGVYRFGLAPLAWHRYWDWAGTRECHTAAANLESLGRFAKRNSKRNMMKPATVVQHLSLSFIFLSFSFSEQRKQLWN